jgi:hypothetical protein
MLFFGAPLLTVSFWRILQRPKEESARVKGFFAHPLKRNLKNKIKSLNLFKKVRSLSFYFGP